MFTPRNLHGINGLFFIFCLTNTRTYEESIGSKAEKEYNC